MNKLGARTKSGGLQLAYHNHDKEFVPEGQGHFPYDLLLQHTDASLMTMQIDLFWGDKDWLSPVPFLKRHPGRVASFHIKERGNTDEGGMLCSGASFIGLNVTPKARVASGVRHFAIENEDDRDHYACAAKTISYLKSLSF